MLRSPDLTVVSAVVNMLAALLCVWIMQAVTGDAGVSSPLKIIKFVHRALFAILAITLAYNAGFTLTYPDIDPRPVDLAVQIIFLAVLIISAVRHKMASQPPKADPQRRPPAGWTVAR